MDVEITKMTSKGQVVIPQGIRQSRGIEEGERFLVYDMGNSIILKRIENLKKASSREEFDEIFSSMWKTAKAKGITEKDVKEQIKEYRKQNA